MSDNFYYHKEKAGVDLYLDRAMNAEAEATRLRELLRETVELLYVIRDHYSVNEITTGEMIECIEKELADE